MAISDLIIPVIHLPWQISTVYHDYRWTIDGIVGTFLCKVVKNAWDISITLSILSMVGMAVDRFHGILFAMKPALMSRKKCLLVIIVSWLSSVALRAHYIYATRPVQYHDGRGLRCRHQWETPQKTKKVDMLTWISFLSLSMLSAIVLSSLYSSIVVSLYRQKRNLLMASETMKSRAVENRKVTCMLVTVVVIFYAVWFLFHVESFIYYFRPDVKVPCYFCWIGYYVLPFLHPVINPVVFCIFSETYYQSFKQLLLCP